MKRRLAKVHPLFRLPLGSGDPREAWRSTERVFNHSGNVARTTLTRRTDRLFFVEVANPPGERVKVGDGPRRARSRPAQSLTVMSTPDW